MQRQPIFNAPAVVVALAAVFVGLHLLLTLVPAETGDHWFLGLALVPARYGRLAAGVPGWSVSAWTAPFTHMLVHADWLHLLVNTGWLLAFGSAIARRTGPLRMLVMFVLCGLAGAALYVAIHPGEPASLIGASGGLSGLMGGVFRFMLRTPSWQPDGQPEAPWQAPLQSLGECLRDPRIRMAAGVWLGVNLLFGLIPPGVILDGTIAWEAHLGGFLLGFLGMGLFERPAVGQPA